MGESTREHLEALLKAFDTGLLITRHGEKEHARPMAVAGIEGPSTIWFLTSTTSPKATELRQDGRVSVTFQSSHRFVALSGQGELVEDRAKIRELWKTAYDVWFPQGSSDPDVTLLRVRVTDAEFWDHAGARGIRYVFDAAKALLTRTPPKTREGLHGRLTEGAAGEPLSQRE